MLFEETIRSKHTLDVYRVLFNAFLKWANKDPESLLFLSKKELQNLIIDYIVHRKKRVSPNSILSNIAPIFKFLDANDVDFNGEKTSYILL